ncbi:hypothetical protein OS493_018964 [Desmophyllum pertusum]|uniref:Uncharacterized protein n=1 Tax=Desmophyllum pertusum TaxID=174260 RepID=A0A9W9YZT0_9CNID|nr:hypothetical protein OS493_018964 [Desmophyllum pertusum]
MDKEELIAILTKSQEEILNSVDSKLENLKGWFSLATESESESERAKFDSAIAAIDKKKLEKAKQGLQESKKLLAERQKLIKLADRSECGWATVSAYVTDDLADTAEDERRISKAEKSAKKAIEAKERNRGPDLQVSNLIALLPILILLKRVLLLTILSSPFSSPFSFDSPPFTLGPSEEDHKQEFASPVVWKDIGEATAPTSSRPFSRSDKSNK